jgi:uncharacterized membrane protein HdeD (DUF308 family)
MAKTNMTSPWWTYLVSGIVSVLLGWYLLSQPINTVVSLVIFLGFYLLVVGLIDTIMSFTGVGEQGSAWGWKLALGLLQMIAGLAVLNNPLFSAVFTATMVMYVIGFVIIATGAVKMFVGREEAAGDFRWTWGSFFLGALYLIFGVWFLASPDRYAIATIVLVSGWFLLVSGITSAALAFVVKGETSK